MRPFPPHDATHPQLHRTRTTRRAPTFDVLALSLAALGLLVAGPALADGEQRTTAAGVLYDAVIERPLSLVETAFGVGITAVAYPLSLGSGRSDVVVQRCITAPAKYTFKRPLGDFSNRPSNDCSPLGFSWGLVKMSFSIIERPLGFLFGRSPLSRDRTPPGQEFEVDLDRGAPGLPPGHSGEQSGGIAI
jgi:hypothetical protein